ncbi:MAG: ATPase, T2SS/T4P/T4SS family [Pseudomonadota bacterium]
MNYSAVETLLTIVNPELIQRYRVIPLNVHGSTLNLGVMDPTDQNAVNAIIFHTGLRVQPVAINEHQYNDFIQTFCARPAPSPLLKELVTQEPLVINENSSNYDEPLIHFVDHILQHAIQKCASDIHIEPYENHCRIRYRQDGILYEITEINAVLAIRLITRLKVMAQLNISERRLPQDGRFQVTHDYASIDIRVNTCPTLFGEKIVLRILDARNLTLALDALGFNPQQLKLFQDKISEPQGLCLVTGPTGSGKTITLYSALNYLNTPAKNISTVEDPVEIRLPGINQVNIHTKIGLDFATTLRTFLRQDPDVIMLGEIRDRETAKIATQAAQTGHLVLSTLHTNNAITTLSRLKTLGVATYNISLIVAQRLIRKLCEFCKTPDKSSRETNIFQARGCQHCLHGYAGRTGIYEVLEITPELAQLMTGNSNTQSISDYLQQSGFLNLQDAAYAMVVNGKTSLNEMNRVLRKFGDATHY